MIIKHSVVESVKIETLPEWVSQVKTAKEKPAEEVVAETVVEAPQAVEEKEVV